MSYNIDNQKIKLLENLVIPLTALYTSEREDWLPEQPKIIDAETMLVSIRGGCDQEIKGHLKDGQLHVTEVELYGEGSGSFFHYVLNDAFEQSTGKFHAVFVWERGDSITKFEVNDGVVTETEVVL